MTDEKPSLEGHQIKIKRLEKDTEKQWAAIEKLQNRLPVWATVVISLLTFLLGGSLGLIMRMSG